MITEARRECGKVLWLWGTVLLRPVGILSGNGNGKRQKCIFFFEPAAEMLIRTYLATAAAETLVVERRWANQSTGAVVIVRQGS